MLAGSALAGVLALFGFSIMEKGEQEEFLFNRQSNATTQALLIGNIMSNNAKCGEIVSVINSQTAANVNLMAQLEAASPFQYRQNPDGTVDNTTLEIGSGNDRILVTRYELVSIEEVLGNNFVLRIEATLEFPQTNLDQQKGLRDLGQINVPFFTYAYFDNTAGRFSDCVGRLTVDTAPLLNDVCHLIITGDGYNNLINPAYDPSTCVESLRNANSPAQFDGNNFLLMLQHLYDQVCTELGGTFDASILPSRCRISQFGQSCPAGEIFRGVRPDGSLECQAAGFIDS